MKKLPTKNTAPVAYEFTGDLKQFKLVSEPTLEAITNDIKKFYEVTTRGADVMMLGRFLLGVSLIKAKAFVGNAKRGVHGGGDGGWMKWKRETFPGCSNNALTDAVNFTTEVFAAWGESQNLQMQILDFQTPEHPDELKGLLTAIRDSMDGAKMTAFCRSIGRIRDAIAPGTNSSGPGKKLSLGEQVEVKQKLARKSITNICESLHSLREDFTTLADDDNEIFVAYLDKTLRAVRLWLKTPGNQRREIVHEIQKILKP